MQEYPRRRPPPLSLHRSHLDSDTYRAVLRILCYCAELENRVAAFPPHPGPREQERPASSEGAAAVGGPPVEDGCGLGEVRSGDGREGHGEGDGRVPLEEDGGQGLGKLLPGGLVDGCPRVADAHIENSPLVDGVGVCEVREEVYVDSRNVGSQKEQSCVCAILSDSLDDLLVDFSCLLEKLDLEEGEREGKDELVSDSLDNKQPLEDAGSLGLSEACAWVDAPEYGEEHRGRTSVDDSLGNASPVVDELPAELVYIEPELSSVPSENPYSVWESCMATQLKVCDSSRPSSNGSGLGELDGHQKGIPIRTVVENEMEEGEIPNEGEVLDFSYDLESQDAAKKGMTSEESHLAGDAAEKRNATHMVGAFTATGTSSGADLIKEELKRTVHESDQIIGRVELKPQKKKKSAKGTKKIEAKVKKKMDSSKKQHKDKKGPEHQNKAKSAVSTEVSIPENIVSGHSSLAEGSLKETAIQTEEKPSSTGDVKVQQKRKRAPLTENRKEKKKLAKKQKRAETNRKLGVKRLKLEMISKPKKVIPCSFYQKGRCQKGGSCMFSHDIIPDTKSTPCTFFACGICLKGDDCPFDHQLSKYPCHTYVSQGR